MITDEELLDVRSLCAIEGIELQGEDGHPFCCGERMQTKGGIIGVDYAHCRQCEKSIGNLASPHINGGYVMKDAWAKKQGERTWARIDRGNRG